jgi:adenosine deaminase
VGVRDAVEHLGASRIGHGVRAIDDPALLDLLAERHIGIEVNLTSNVQTHAVGSYEEHPMARFLERGLLATLNTDDPTISGIDLRHEYEVAAPQAGLGPAAVRRAQANALEIAYLSTEEKAVLRERAAARGEG